MRAFIKGIVVFSLIAGLKAWGCAAEGCLMGGMPELTSLPNSSPRSPSDYTSKSQDPFASVQGASSSDSTPTSLNKAMKPDPRGKIDFDKDRGFLTTNRALHARGPAASPAAREYNQVLDSASSSDGVTRVGRNRGLQAERMPRTIPGFE